MLTDMKANAPTRTRILLTLAPAGVAKLDEIAQARKVSRLEIIRAALRFALGQPDAFAAFLTRHLEV
jgi:predicted transcriptional regulator